MSRIAILGGGAAGLGAARRLVDAGVEVTLFEAAPQLGGNCQAAQVQGADGRRWTFDAGVSDFNRTTFVEFSRLIDELGLPTRPIGTDTSFTRPDGKTVASCRAGVWRFDEGVAASVEDDFAAETDRFRLRAVEVLDDARFASWSLGRYLDHIGASRALRDFYVVPRATGSFPMPGLDGEDLPLRGLIEFWRIHGVVGSAPADRHCVVGGMHRYPAVFAAWFRARGGELRCSTRVSRLVRDRRGVVVHGRDAGRELRERFDAVICATAPGHTLAMLSDPTTQETAALSGFAAQSARVVLHQDPAAVGSERAALGAFNYVVADGTRRHHTPTITFFPKRLAGMPAEAPDVFVTMNPVIEPRRELVLGERSFLHPVAGPAQRSAAAAVESVQGHRSTWFAGSFLRSPFVHESALVSGMRAAEQVLGSRRMVARLAS